MTIIRGGNWLDKNVPIWEFPGWKLSGWKLSWVGVVRVGIFLDGNCPNVSYLGWEFPLVEAFGGGNCPVGIIRGAIFRVGVFMLPMCVGANNNFHVKQNE